MDYKESVVAIPNKMYTEDGEDISPKYYWDDVACDTGCERTLHLNDDENLKKDMEEELKNCFFIPMRDVEHENLKSSEEVMAELRKKLKDMGSEVHKKEAVNHPDHYNFGKYETIDIIKDQLSEEEFTGFCLGNAIKYISRCHHKNHFKEDIKKAIWYLNQVVEN